MVKKLNVSLKNEQASVKKELTNPLETEKQGVANQKLVIEQHFTGVNSLSMLREDLHTEALARRG